MAEPLWFTDDPAACELLGSDSFALLVGFAIDQQVPVQKAFAGPYVLKQRAGTLDPRRLAERDLGTVFAEKPAPLSTGDVPLIGVVPAADKVKSATVAVPPLSFVTTLRRCNCGAMSLLVIVQVASWPLATVMLEPLCEPPTHTQALAVYLPVAAADSASDKA